MVASLGFLHAPKQIVDLYCIACDTFKANYKQHADKYRCCLLTTSNRINEPTPPHQVVGFGKFLKTIPAFWLRSWKQNTSTPFDSSIKGSQFWNGIQKWKDVFNLGAQFLVGDGADTDFFGSWVGCRPRRCMWFTRSSTLLLVTLRSLSKMPFVMTRSTSLSSSTTSP